MNLVPLTVDVASTYLADSSPEFHQRRPRGLHRGRARLRYCTMKTHSLYGIATLGEINEGQLRA